MVKKRLTLAILCAFAVVFIAGCNGADLKPISEMTPKEKSTFYMAVYSDQAENYKTLAASPNLTEAQKSVLRTKKEIMAEVYPLIDLYSGYVEAGAVPDKEVEAKIIGYLDRLAMMSTE